MSKRIIAKVISFSLAVIMILSLTTGPLGSIVTSAAETHTYRNFEYTVSGTNATITAYTGSSENVTIPSTISSYKVTTIAKKAFGGNTTLVSVTIPASITKIEDAYYNDEGAFQNCSKLQNVTFAAGSADAVIGKRAFQNCVALTTVTIPGNYSAIKDSAFEDCKNLKSLTYKQSSYSYANQVVNYAAFKNCTALETVSLPTTLKSIGEDAFLNTAMVNLVIPEGVTSIGKSAFNGCAYLKSVSIPSTVTEIADAYYNNEGAFQNCTSLKTVVFAEGERDLYIGKRAFAGISGLETVHLPLNLTSVGDNAFDSSKSNLTICAKSNSSYAKTYAGANSINFKVCNGSHIVDAPVAPSTYYTVTFDAKGGTGCNASATVGAGNSVVLPTPVKSYTLTYNLNGGEGDDYTQNTAAECLGWSTSSQASSANYRCGVSFVPLSNTTLYAVWGNASHKVDSSIPEREGFTFLGWSTDANADKAEYAGGDSYVAPEGATLYAIWEEDSGDSGFSFLGFFEKIISFFAMIIDLILSVFS